MSESLYGKSLPIYDPKNQLEYMMAKAQHPWTHSQEDERGLLLSPHTDMDHFPYRRYYRGRHNSKDPYIHTRRAGYTPRMDRLYTSPGASEQCDPYLNLRHDLSYSEPYTETAFETGCCQSYPSYHPNVRWPHNLIGYRAHIPNISIMNR